MFFPRSPSRDTARCAGCGGSTTDTNSVRFFLFEAAASVPSLRAASKLLGVVEGWRQRRLGSMGNNFEKEEIKKRKEKTEK
jgi:hypothetical protein